MKVSSEEITESREQIEAQSQITSKQNLNLAECRPSSGPLRVVVAARRAWLLVAAHACLREAHGTTAYEERSLATRTQETAAGRGEGTDERITIDDTTEKKY